ncbi:replication-relaxation family protein [Streptosporangium sp. NPDC051022]|uniref:replication-relaxation family protein n=1 Tax=Streptosporangium sp. NPDC051022 TaxID=3155752 RepID=UPI00343CCDB7
MSTSRFTPLVLAQLAARLTFRDRRLLRLVKEQRVLTSPQIAQIAFDTDDAARKRLLALHHMGVLDRFRPILPPGMGTAPYHYVLGPAGAAVLASEDGVDVTACGYRRDRVLSIAYSQRLAHTVGTNGFGADLYGFARRHTDAELVTWWPENRCASVWGDTVRPDAYGRWRQDEYTVDFFLEYDTGSEPLDRVVRKLDGYATLSQATQLVTPVLFWVQGGRREANLRRKLVHHPAHMFVPIATGSPSALVGPVDDGPAGEKWLPSDTEGPRLRLAELALYWPGLGSRDAAAQPAILPGEDDE